MKLLKAFIAGSFFPFIASSLILWMASVMDPTETQTVAAGHGIPYLWGAWNALYFLGFRHIIPGGEALKAWIYGALLGLVVACMAVLWLQLPEQMGWPPSMLYAPFVVAPLVYGIVWRYIVHPLNRLLRVNQ